MRFTSAKLNPNVEAPRSIREYVAHALFLNERSFKYLDVRISAVKKIRWRVLSIVCTADFNLGFKRRR